MSPKRRRARTQTAHTSAPDPQSPAGRYAAFKSRQVTRSLNEFQAMFDFPLDDFQLDACNVLDQGEDVLVAAPTSAGKTVVGLYGIFLALSRGQRLFYTTPIKALSNQKFLELGEHFGEANVGLLTGDIAVNGGAPVIVMTTEVLRNMIYAGSSLENLGFVVMDEVHYLSDHFRGPVWEEIIIHLDPSVRLISLSATVSNASDFATWLETLRGPTRVVTAQKRPVPLQHLMVTTDGEIMPLFEGNRAGGNLNRALLGEAAHMVTRRRGRMPRIPHPDRARIARVLEKREMLPAIQFIFSRSGCDNAAREVYHAGVRLTSKEESHTIRERIQTGVAGISPTDLAAIDMVSWEDTLAAGIAQHHAGLLPIQKQLVESLFAEGLIRLVFATETLALGINMPARTVVLEALNKWNGSTRADLTPGEYTQLTGRAGRRGIDTYGFALTLLAPKNPPQVLASLAVKQTYPLHSAFAPNYNMAVNLLARTTLEGAGHTVEKSFAQYEALGSSRKLLTSLNRFENSENTQREAAKCSRGDIFELLETMGALTKAEKLARQRRHGPENTEENRNRDRALIEQARSRMKSHPCYSCPERDTHLSHARTALKAQEQVKQTRKRIELRTKSLARQLRNICKVLQELGYLDADFGLTEAGEMLRSVYSERDLLVAQCLRLGLFDTLSIGDLAGALSVCLAENRSGAMTRLIPAEASRSLAGTLEEMARINYDLTRLQEEHFLEPYPTLETGLAPGLSLWAQGRTLGECLEVSEVGAGDFVRAVRQVIDLADQLRKIEIPGSPTLNEHLRELGAKLKRGVVAWDF